MDSFLDGLMSSEVLTRRRFETWHFLDPCLHLCACEFRELINCSGFEVHDSVLKMPWVMRRARGSSGLCPYVEMVLEGVVQK